MSYSAIDLSKYIVNKCVNDHCPISNLQLQKILYFIQKEYLKKKGKKAFDDPIEAWQFGPVVPNSYYQFYGSGAMKIIRNFDIDIEECDKEICDPIIEEKRAMSTWKLVEESHKPGGAWDKTFAGGKGNHCRISEELIKAE